MSTRPKRSRAGLPRSSYDESPVPPEYGSVFRTAIVPEELDAVYGVPYLRAESEDTYLFVRLSGTSDEQGGLFRFVLLLPDRPPLLQCVSLRGRFWAIAQHTRIPWSDLSSDEATSILDVLEDPPAGGQRIRPPYIPVAPRPPPPAYPGRSVSDLPTLRHLYLRPCHLPQPSLSEILADRTGPLRKGPSDHILSDLRHFGVLDCDLAHHPTSTICYNTFITAVKRVAGRHTTADRALEFARQNPHVVCPDPGAFIQSLPPSVSRRRSCAPGLCPTLLSCLGRHPIRIHCRQYYSTNHVLSLFGHPLTGPFAVSMRQLLSPELAYSRLSASLSMHVLVPILTACRSLGYLPSTPWTVVTAFTGLETFMEAINLMQPAQPATLLAASECDLDCRRFVKSRYPNLRRFPTDSTSAAATVQAPDCTLLCMGSPCVTWSNANRFRTAAQLDAALSVLQQALAYFSVSRPAIRLFLWENVASLLSPALEKYSERVFNMLLRLSPHLSLGQLCSSQFGAAMVRPRLYILVRFPSGFHL